MPVQQEELEREMSADQKALQAAPLSYSDQHLDRLLVSEVEEPWWKSFVENIRSIIRPEKLPPLEVTSKPVAVRDIWQERGNKKYAGVSSIAIHAGVIALLFLIGTNKHVQQAVKETATIFAPVDLAPYKAMPKKDKLMGGGGGGGDKSPLPASQGKLPKIAPRQFTPPQAVINNPNPKLVMEPTIVVQPDAPLPQVMSPNYGNPLAIPGPPSNGQGSGGGIGSGRGGGVGSGNGVGFGPGSGAGTGGGVYRIGGGVSSPIPIYKPEPEYSEEARKAKFQGVVLLAVVIDEDGKTSNIRVLRPLGLGLDEKAIEAVQKWRFRPSMKDGRPVAVQANIEVNFRLL
jgi:periplasmic protein TonB